MAGPTPFKLERAPMAASKSFLLKMALNAFLLSCKTTLGVFIWIKSFSRGRNTPLWIKGSLSFCLRCYTSIWFEHSTISHLIETDKQYLKMKYSFKDFQMIRLYSPQVSTWWSEQAPRVWHVPPCLGFWSSLANHFGTCNNSFLTFPLGNLDRHQLVPWETWI